MNLSISLSSYNNYLSTFNWSGASTTGVLPLYAPSLNNRPNVLNSTVKMRLRFLRKVFGILSAQFLLTTLVCTATMSTTVVKNFLSYNIWIWLIWIFADIVIVQACYMHEYPMNYYILGAFVRWFHHKYNHTFSQIWEENRSV
jgi:FtsH-binding integral membrane protein